MHFVFNLVILATKKIGAKGQKLFSQQFYDF